jgi:predicted neuraminidase
MMPNTPQSEQSLMEDRYDVVVVGAGMAGIMAAIAAKTSDNRVLIIEPSNVLGGQGTVGGVAGFCGDSKRVNDEFSELINRLEKHGLISKYDPTADRREYDLEWCAFFLQEIVLEKDIDILLHSRVINASVTDGKVDRLTISTAGGILECICGFVVDASGQCRVATLSGFPVVHEGANKQLPMSLYFTLWDTGKSVEPFLPADSIVWENEEEIPMTSLHVFPSGKVEVKMKVVGFDAADGFSRSKAEMHARRHMMSLIYFLQTKGYGGVKLDRHVLASVSRSIGIREEKRIVGEHVLTEDEVSRGTVFPDAVAVGTYHFDYHWPDKMQRAGTGITTMVEPYHIPLSCMVPKGSRNLLVTGRAASGDQLALSSFRVMATVAQMGFGSGHAARLCVEQSCDLNQLGFAELHKQIESGGQSLDLSSYGDYLRQSLLTHEYIFRNPQVFEKCHAPTLLLLKNNRFLTAWFAGSGEGHSDVGIWLSERFQCAWSKPRLVAKVNDLPHWNPVLFQASDHRVHLYFKTGASPREWKTWRIISADEGGSWSAPEVLGGKENLYSPGPVKNKPIILTDGTCLAPNSIEDGKTWSVFVDRSHNGGMTWVHSPLLSCTDKNALQSAIPSQPPEEIDPVSLPGEGFIQPTLWESAPGTVHMLVRSSYGKVYRSDSLDRGKTWAPLYRTDLPNNNSGLDVVKLQDGTLVLASNPISGNWDQRTPLSLVASFDNGETWAHRLDLESAEGEFSYPAIISTGRGIALAYSWNREKIAFWHGSIEQMTDPELVEMRNKILHTGVVSMEA